MELSPAQVIDLWFHYEEIAMHFNELTLQYRLQVMGGVGAIGAVAAFLTQGGEDEERRYFIRWVVAFVLFFLILAAAILDLFYYKRLLHGAVAAIIELEETHPPINMSTHIRAAVDGWGAVAIHIWYGAILLPVAAFGTRSYRRYKGFHKNKNG